MAALFLCPLIFIISPLSFVLRCFAVEFVLASYNIITKIYSSIMGHDLQSGTVHRLHCHVESLTYSHWMIEIIASNCQNIPHHHQTGFVLGILIV